MNTSTIRGTAVQGKLIWAGISLIALEGLIHLLDAPDSFEEVAYKGLLFATIVVGAVVAAIDIYRGRGWGLGVLIAGSAFVGYVISRTIGLPGLPVDERLEPLGILSLLVEGLFIGLCLAVSIHRGTSSSVKERPLNQAGAVLSGGDGHKAEGVEDKV